MDADTRHQLKQNELAEAIGKLKDWKSNPTMQFTILALIGVLVVVFAVRGFFAWRNSGFESESAKFGEMQVLTGDPNQRATAAAGLEELATGAGRPGIAALARLHLARIQVDKAFADPNAREQAFKDAAAIYKAVAENAAVPAPIVASAIFGLATTEECVRNFDQAKAEYTKLAGERFSGSPYQKLAAERLKNLDDLKQQIIFLPGMAPSQASATPAPSFMATAPGGQTQVIQPTPVPPEEVARLGLDKVPPPGAPQPAPAPAQPATGDKPAEQPAQPPTEKPAEQPADKPADKPAEPAPAPAPQNP